jgi:putative DNA primase/helicase
MKHDTVQNGGRVEAVGDEAVYLRINQLQKGLLQFIDSTNAERLVREYGSEIRYIAPWKKWIVWDDTHWQVDTGALLYAKQLQMVRNIYAELYKTADYRDRMDTEKYAVQSESIRVGVSPP